ncbi:hypothetical protein PsAD2_02997 [Pseudovibrio axinellae]|uniref:Uncharacterized protein n=1 Tax=Pseudovibrio axinellae TaxID=989403 RepID=A0A165XFM5_9HYPH|nr:hypothetical protein [Pseudovibrio axinellae]KZL17661.1 hypothetical protein PsAD2_02997 [Pseudovibrio axinellae]SER44589.1 hypothetical protein SAMN05421798_11085 [Pseudovibrio axinellae]
MRVFFIVCSLFLSAVQSAQAAPRITAQDLVFGEQSLVGQRVQLTSCMWVANGVYGMSCRVFYNGQFLTTLIANFSNDQMPLVRLMLDNCVKENPRCQFDIEAEVVEVGQRPELKDVRFDF